MLETVAQVTAFVGVLVFLAHLFSGIFSKTRIPVIIMLILIGVGVGPIWGLVSPASGFSPYLICGEKYSNNTLYLVQQT